ncbi:hypothetical protein D3C72_2585030 [compost metagenome]
MASVGRAGNKPLFASVTEAQTCSMLSVRCTSGTWRSSGVSQSGGASSAKWICMPPRP